MFANRSERNEQSLQRTFHRCILPNFSSFEIAVSEENMFQKSTNQKQEWPMAAIFVNRSELNDQSLQRTFHRCILPNFSSFDLAVSEEKIFQKSTNQKQEWRVPAMFANGSVRNEKSLQRTFHRDFLPILDSFGKVISKKKIFRNRPIRNKNSLWRPCLLMNRDEMRNLYRGHSIDASYQISVHVGAV